MAKTLDDVMAKLSDERKQRVAARVMELARLKDHRRKIENKL